MSALDDLFAAAADARSRAYAPYSRFAVGAAIRSPSGRIYRGANVENAAYPVGVCAEASAISAMIEGGDRVIEAILVVGGGELLVTPCGGCRQRIREFGQGHTPVHVAGPEGIRASFTLETILPHSFGPDNLSSRSASGVGADGF